MRAAELAKALHAVRSGRQWKCKCVAHEDSNPSMIIFDGREHVQVRCMAGCEPEDIIAVLRSRALWEGSEQQEVASPKKSEKSLQAEQREHRLRILARCIFDGCSSITGTVAERYFESRDLLSVANMISDVRFHPRCPRGSGSDYHEQPTVVIAMRSIVTNAVVGIQRIFLTRDAKKDGAMMLGSAGGAAMKLQHLQDGTLHVCEGLETGLAIIAMDHGPVWALGSTSNMQSFPVIASVDDLTIWSDRDYDPDAKKIVSPGVLAAEQCCTRWREAGRTSRILKALKLNEDAADVWRDRLARP